MARGRTLALRVQAEISGLDRIDKLGKRISDLGAEMTKKVTLPLLAGAGAAFKFASDLDEASGRAAKVFEEDAARIRQAAGSMDDAFSEAAFLDAASGLGALLQQIGFVEKEAANLSLAWLDLSQDMASFHDTKPDDALGAIRSALAGEFEPLKQYGVFLNETIVRQKALELGLYDGVGALDAQTRALVVNQELFAQQPKVLGDFERTAEKAANATRILIANFTDAAAALGTELLPLGTELLKTVNGWVKAFKELSPEARTWIVRLAGIAAATGPVLFVFGKLLSSIKLFVGAGKLLIDAWRHIPTALGFLDLALARLGPAFAGAMTAARTFAAFLAGPVGIAVAAFATGFATDFLGMRTRFEKDMGDIVDFLGDAGDAFRDFFGIVEEELPKISKTADREFEAFTTVTHAHLLAAKGVVESGVTDMAAEMGEAPKAMADEMLAAQFELGDAISELVAFMDQALSPAQEIFAARSFLASQEYANALTDNNPLIRQKAAEMGAVAQEVLDRLDGSRAGQAFSQSFAYGLTSPPAMAAIRNNAVAAAAAARGIFPDSEPKDPRSPFRGITKGFGFGDILARGLLTGRNAVSGAFRDLVGGGIGGFGAMQPLHATAGGSGGPTIVNNNFTFHGEPARTENDLTDMLQALSTLGGGSVRYG